MAASDRHLLIERNPGEWCLAVLLDDRLDALIIERDHEPSSVGDIILGRVRSVLPGLKAAFVDIGQKMDGFLPQQDARWLNPDVAEMPINGLVQEGQALLLQIKRDADDGKGPRLTADIGIGGDLLVLRPRGDGVQISRRITQDDKRQQLQTGLSDLGHDCGWIVRTQAATAGFPEITAEAESLLHQWQGIRMQAEKLKAPAAAHRANSGLAGCLHRISLAGVSRITVDSDATAAAFAEISSALPASVTVCREFSGPLESEGAAEQIDALTRPECPLPGGGLIRIERTSAATTIDVDSANATGTGGKPVRHGVNEAAAREIPRQLRLRNVGGLVFIDFILDRDRKPADSLINALKAGLSTDPEQPRVTGLTPSGMVEIIRPRSGPMLSERLTEPGRTNPSVETVALMALKTVLRQSRSDPSIRPSLRASREIVDLYRGDLSAALQETERALHCPLSLSVDDRLQRHVEIDQT